MSKRNEEVKLRASSLDWALAHLRRFSDSDLLPPSFEFTAIGAYWTKVRASLLDINLATYETRPLQQFLVPKPECGYRLAIRLDPLDCLVYTALVHEFADAIEQSRIPKERRIACSYRLAPSPEGRFFAKETGWDDYHDRTEELCGSADIKCVLIADIADFYTQLSHHRIENALESAGVPRARATVLEERILHNWTSLTSRGIPVGPQASAPLAEICLHDVDQFLAGRGYDHTRYVDDFRIFCRSRREAQEALHDLSQYLYTAHRLGLQTSKTKIIETDLFLESWLRHPDRLQQALKEEKVNELASEMTDTPSCAEESLDFATLLTEDAEAILATADDEPVLSDEDERQAGLDAMSELFHDCVSDLPLNLGLARHLLRKAARIKTRIIQHAVLENLEELAPAFRDVAWYLYRTSNGRSAPEVAAALLNYAENGERAFLPSIQQWIFWLLSTRLRTHYPERTRKLVDLASDEHRLEMEAALAAVHGEAEWVRDKRETWKNNGAWTRRAIIRAGVALPETERQYWANVIVGSGDVLEAAVAVHFLRASKTTKQ